MNNRVLEKMILFTLTLKGAYMKSFLICFFIYIVNGVNVALTIDDGWAEHYQMAQDLQALNAKGVFYINSARLGAEGRLTLEQLYNISAMGHEIGGHTLEHIDLSTQNYQQQKTSVCDDRNTLLSLGFNATTFAYPFGGNNDDSFYIVGLCGYNGARDSGGIRTAESCLNCPKSDNIIPMHPLQIRSVSYRRSWGLDGMKWFVDQANADPKYANGVIAFIFHEYGNYTNKDGSILPEDFIAFVQWLQSTNNPIITLDSTINTRVYPNFDTISNGNVKKNPSKLYIAFTFDDGTVDHYDVVSGLLEQYDTRGTFFVNSGTIGTPGFMTSTHLQTLQSRGHEIGGHGPNQHEHIISLTSELQLQRLQSEYNNLTSFGLSISSFSWPYGEDSASLIQAAKQTGYKRARDVGGLKVPTSCTSCPSTLELPLSDASKFAIRSFNVKSTHTFGDLMWQTFRAEDWMFANPGKKSILVFTFGTVCDGCAFSPAKLQNFLRWLQPRYKIGTTNELIKNVI